MPSFYSWEEVLLSPEDDYFNSTVVMSPGPPSTRGKSRMAESQRAAGPGPDDDGRRVVAANPWHVRLQPDVRPVVLEHAGVPVDEHDFRDRMVPPRGGARREQPRVAGLAAQRYLAGRELGVCRVLWALEGAELRHGEHLLARDRVPVLDAG
ncbi:hypothetical protein AcV7_003784 [Taiwanofungus camphoratus]|nr:hypothetical protein AcV7_003784 [Antrodia cinnamomea]